MGREAESEGRVGFGPVLNLLCGNLGYFGRFDENTRRLRHRE